MEYIIASSHNLEGLQSDVNSKIKEGYQPIGGVACAFIERNAPALFFYQAMTKNVEPEQSTQYLEKGIDYV